MKKLLLILTMVFHLSASAQVDPHFSQYYAYPLWLNPAMTGAFNGSFRITGIYRSQWGNITNPFSTQGLSADVVTNANLNFGANLLNQTAGDGGYHYITGSASIAYSGLRFGSEGLKQVLFGIQGGFINRRFDPTKFQFGDQWNALTGFNPNTPSADVVTKTFAAALDIGAGISYIDMAPEQNVNVFGGFSVMHLNQPEDPFLAGNKTKLPMRFTAHGGAKIAISDNASVTPNFLYMRQGTAQEKMIGCSTELVINEASSFIFGANYRIDDAITPFVGWQYNDLVVGAAYDKTISNLGKMVAGTNSFELSLHYSLPMERYKDLPCPKF